MTFHLEDTATGETKTYEVLDVDAMFDKDAYRSPFRYTSRDKLIEFSADPDNIETRCDSEVGKAHICPCCLSCRVTTRPTR